LPDFTASYILHTSTPVRVTNITGSRSDGFIGTSVTSSLNHAQL
jgi:hypothetical protein